MRQYHIGQDNKQLLVAEIGMGENRSLKSNLPLLTGGEKCPNCSDMQRLNFVVVEKRGYREQEIKHFSFRCPDCVDHNALISSYLSKTGLDTDDQYYRLNYVADMPDKRIGFNWANNHLSSGNAVNGFEMLRGNFGTGKTGLAKALVVQLAMLGVYTHYTTAKDIIMMATSTFSNRNMTELAVVRDFCQYRVLVVDEVDEITDSSYSLTTLRNILDKRYVMKRNKLTVMITNRKNDFWPYLFSRLDDGAIIEIGGQSLRGVS